MEPWTFATKSSVLRRLGAAAAAAAAAATAAAAAAADAAADADATKEQLHRERRLERLGLQKDACDELVVSMLRLLLQSGRPGLGGPGAQPVLRRKLERRPVRVPDERDLWGQQAAAVIKRHQTSSGGHQVVIRWSSGGGIRWSSGGHQVKASC